MFKWPIINYFNGFEKEENGFLPVFRKSWFKKIPLAMVQMVPNFAYRWFRNGTIFCLDLQMYCLTI